MEKSNFITPWQEVHTIVDDAMAKGDRTVTIYISPDGGMSISVFPWPDEESLRSPMTGQNLILRLSRKTGFSSRVKP